jgi:hypothetical protein
VAGLEKTWLASTPISMMKEGACRDRESGVRPYEEERGRQEDQGHWAQFGLQLDRLGNPRSVGVR